MKRLFTILAFVFLTASLLAQSPEKMSYQAVIRNSSGVLVSNQGIGMRISILQGSPTGTLIWTETCTPNPQTNDNGLVTIEIGGNNPLSIDWSTGGPYFLKTETDPTGGTDYTISGTSQLLSVPYALHAKTVASYPETDPVFAGWDKSTGISIPNTQISNWSGATSAFLTGITSGQVTTALGFTPYNSTNPSGYTSNTGTVTSVAMSAPVGLTVAGTPVTTSGTLDLTLTPGYAIPTTDQLFPGLGTTADKAANGNHTHDYSGVYAALVHDHSGIYEPVIAAGTTSQYWRGDKSWQPLSTDAVTEGANLYYTDARAMAAISLTTTGNSGTATYTSGVINVPNYTLSGLGGQSALNGTGLVRMTGTSVSYDNSTYLTSFTETDPNAVLLTGNQTIVGNKTFTGTTTVPTPVNATDAATKAYVDATGQTPGTAPGQMQYWNGTAWVVINATQNEAATLQMISGVPTWVGGTPPPPNVTNPTTGKIWMDRNLGATQVATSSTDAASYGDLYQWGRGTDGHQIRTSATTSTLSSTDVPGHGDFILAPNSPYDWRSPQNDNLWQGISGINNPCPAGYRIPTNVELIAERTSWSSNNSAGAFASPLKLPVAGNRHGWTGSLANVGSGGIYWSSTVFGTNSYYLYFGSGSATMTDNLRVHGYSVRCIKD